MVGGKVRKDYVLTRRGGRAPNDARAKIGELGGEILEAGVERRAGSAGKASMSAARRRS
ncbi:MAG TPA: hypothetical protein VFC42_01930 [Methylomirabilota bacterium]|nr:hypothetical protein [Methylomirabilota bacterium]